MTQIAPINLAGLLSYKEGINSIDRIMTYISYQYSEKKQSRENDNSHPNVKYIKKMEESHGKISDSLYFAFFPENITKIMKPKTDKGYAVTKSAVNLALSRNSMLNTPISGQQMKSYNAMANYRNSIKKNTTADHSVTLLDIEAFKIRDENGLDRFIGIYDYGFVNFDKNGKESGKNGLIGIMESSRMNLELIKISNKIKNGQSLTSDEDVTYEFISRLGQSFKEGGVNMDDSKKWFMTALTSKSVAKFQTLENLEYGRRMLRKLGDQQGFHNGLHVGYKNMIDDLFSSISKDSIIAGHNIKKFDLPYIKHIIENVAGAKEYIKNTYSDKLSYIFGKNANIYDSLEVLRNLDPNVKNELLSNLSRGRDISGTLGQADTLIKLMAPEDEDLDIHHFAYGDSRAEGQMMGIIPFSDGKYNSLYEMIDKANIESYKNRNLGNYNGGNIIVQPLKNHNPYDNLGYVYDGSGRLYFSNKIVATDERLGKNKLSHEPKYAPTPYKAGETYQITSMGIISPKDDPRLKNLGKDFSKYQNEEVVAVTMKQLSGEQDSPYLRGERSSTILVPKSQFEEYFANEMAIVQVGDTPTDLGKKILKDRYGVTNGNFFSVSNGSIKDRVLENAERRIKLGKTNAVLKAIDLRNIADKADIQLDDIASAVKEVFLTGNRSKYESIVSGEKFTKNLESYKFYGFEDKKFYNFFIKDQFNQGWFDNTMAIAETMDVNSIPAKLAMVLKDTFGKNGYSTDEKDFMYSKALEMALTDYGKDMIKTETVKAKADELVLNIPNFMRSTRMSKMVREKKDQFTFKLNNSYAVLESLRKTVANVNYSSRGLKSSDHAIIYKFINSILDEEKIFSNNEDERVNEVAENLRKIASDIELSPELKIEALEQELLKINEIDQNAMKEKKVERNLLNTDFFRKAAPESFDPKKYITAAEKHMSKNLIDSKDAYDVLSEYMTGGNYQREKFKESVKIIGEERAKKRLNMFDLHKNALERYSRTLIDAIEENGGVFQIDKETGKIMIGFSDNLSSMIDASTLIPRLEANRGYASLRIGRSNYIPRFYANLSINGKMTAVSDIEDVLHSNGIYTNTLSQRIKNARAIGKTTAEVMREALSSVAAGLRETERDEGFTKKAAENFGIINVSKRLLGTKEGRDQLRNYLNNTVDKYGSDNEDIRSIQKFLLKNLDAEGEVMIPSSVVNSFTALQMDGFLPVNVGLGDMDVRLHVAVKGSKAQQGYLGMDDMITGSNAFTSLPRGIEHVEKSTVVLNKALIEERASKIIGVNIEDEIEKAYGIIDNRVKYTRAITVNDKMTEVSLNGYDFDSSMGITSREMNTFTRDKIFMGNNAINRDFEQKYGKEILNRLKSMVGLRIQPYESGGFMTGRYIRTAGYLYGERLIDPYYREFNDINEATNLKIGFGTDTKGRITPKYKTGKLVKAGEYLIDSYSLHGDTKEDFKAKKASVVNMQYVPKGSSTTVTEEQVTDIIYKEALKDGKKELTVEEFQKYANKLFDRKIVAKPITYSSNYKILQGGNKEKSFVQHGLTDLRTFGDENILRILDMKGFKEASKRIGTDITTVLLEEDFFNDIAEGRFESVLFDGVDMKDVKAEISKFGRNKWNEILNRNRSLLDRFVLAHTGADLITKSSEEAAKHKSDPGFKIEQTYTRIKNKLVSEGVSAEKAEAIALAAVNEHIDKSLEVDKKGNLIFPDTRDIVVNIKGLDETAKKFNLEKTPLSQTTVEFTHDSTELNKKAVMGKREFSALNNIVLSENMLSEIYEGIDDEETKAQYLKTFGKYIKDGKFVIDPKNNSLWGESISEIIENNIFYGDGKGTTINSENDLESGELKEYYRKLRKRYSDSLPITKELLEDISLVKSHDKARELNKFESTADADKFIRVSAAEANIAPVGNNARYYMDVDKTIWQNNTQVDLLDEELGLTEKFFKEQGVNSSIYIPKDIPSINGNELVLKNYQQASKSVVKSYRNLKDFLSNKEAVEASPRRADLLRETLVKSIKEYTDAQYKYSTSSKQDGLRYDIANKRFELSARGKSQIYQLDAIKRGDADIIFDKFEYNGKSLAERYKNNELVNFQISSTKDLDKFGFTDEYFKRRGIDKAEWLKKAKTEGVKAVFNRSPSDYPHSSVAVQLYFSDDIEKGLSITDEITAVLTKNDADGDSTIANVLRSLDDRKNGLLLDDISASILNQTESEIIKTHDRAIELQMRHFNRFIYDQLHPKNDPNQKIIDDVYHEDYQKRVESILKENGMDGYIKGSRATFMSPGEKIEAIEKYQEAINIVRNYMSEEERADFDKTNWHDKSKKIRQYADNLQDDDRLIVRNGMYAFEDMMSASSAYMLKSGQNIVADIDKGLDVLDALRNMYQADANTYNLDQETLNGMLYFKESSKEGFLSPKHGDYKILDPEFRGVAETMKGALNTILSGNGNVNEAFKTLEDTVASIGRDVTGSGRYDPNITHVDMIKKGIKGIRQVVGSINPEYRATIYGMSEYLRESTQNITDPLARINEIQNILNDNLENVESIFTEKIPRSQENNYVNIEEAMKASRMVEEKIAQSKASNFSRIADKVFAPRKPSSGGGIGKSVMMLAASIIGAGYAGGNPSAPAGTEARTRADQENQNYSIEEMPKMPNSNLSIMRQGPKQGYIININARTEQETEEISRIISEAVNNNFQNVQTNISLTVNNDQTSMSMSDMYDYISNSL